MKNTLKCTVLILFLFVFLSDAQGQLFRPYILIPNNYTIVEKRFLTKINENENVGELEIGKELFLSTIKRSKADSIQLNRIKWNYANFLSRNNYNSEAISIYKELMENTEDEYAIFSCFSMANIYFEYDKINLAKKYIQEGERLKSEKTDKNTYNLLLNIAKSAHKEVEPDLDSSIIFLRKAYKIITEDFPVEHFNKSFGIAIICKISDLNRDKLDKKDKRFDKSRFESEFTSSNLEVKNSIEKFSTNSDITKQYCTDFLLQNHINIAYENLVYGSNNKSDVLSLEHTNILSARKLLFDSLIVINPIRYLQYQVAVDQLIAFQSLRFSFRYDEIGLLNQHINKINEINKYINKLVEIDQSKYWKLRFGLNLYISTLEEKGIQEYLDVIYQTLKSREEATPNAINHYWAIYYYNLYWFKKQYANENAKDICENLEKSIEYFNYYKIKSKKLHHLHYFAIQNLSKGIRETGYLPTSTDIEREEIAFKFKAKNNDIDDINSFYSEHSDGITLYAVPFRYFFATKYQSQIPDLYYTETCSACSGKGHFLDSYYKNGSEGSQRRNCSSCNGRGSYTVKRYKAGNSFYYGTYENTVISKLNNYKKLF